MLKMLKCLVVPSIFLSLVLTGCGSSGGSGGSGGGGDTGDTGSGGTSDPVVTLKSITVDAHDYLIVGHSLKNLQAIARYTNETTHEDSTADITSRVTWSVEDADDTGKIYAELCNEDKEICGVDTGSITVTASVGSISDSTEVTVVKLKEGSELTIVTADDEIMMGTTTQLSAIGTFQGETDTTGDITAYLESWKVIATYEGISSPEERTLTVIGNEFVMPNEMGTEQPVGAADIEISGTIKLNATDTATSLPKIVKGYIPNEILVTLPGSFENKLLVNSEQTLFIQAKGYAKDSTTPMPINQDIRRFITISAPDIVTFNPNSTITLTDESTDVKISASYTYASGTNNPTYSGSATLSSHKINEIKVTPAVTVIKTSQQMTATGLTDVEGLSVNLTDKVEWSSDNTTIVTVSADSGLVKAKTYGGPATITAHWPAENLSNSTSITVQEPSRVEFSSSPEFQVDTPIIYQATAYYNMEGDPDVTADYTDLVVWSATGAGRFNYDGIPQQLFVSAGDTGGSVIIDAKHDAKFIMVTELHGFTADGTALPYSRIEITSDWDYYNVNRGLQTFNAIAYFSEGENDITLDISEHAKWSSPPAGSGSCKFEFDPLVPNKAIAINQDRTCKAAVSAVFGDKNDYRAFEPTEFYVKDSEDAIIVGSMYQFHFNLNEEMNYADAAAYCKSLTFSEKAWRLPEERKYQNGGTYQELILYGPYLDLLSEREESKNPKKLTYTKEGSVVTVKEYPMVVKENYFWTKNGVDGEVNHKVYRVIHDSDELPFYKEAAPSDLHYPVCIAPK